MLAIHLRLHFALFSCSWLRRIGLVTSMPPLEAFMSGPGNPSLQTYLLEMVVDSRSTSDSVFADCNEALEGRGLRCTCGNFSLVTAGSSRV